MAIASKKLLLAVAISEILESDSETSQDEGFTEAFSARLLKSKRRRQKRHRQKGYVQNVVTAFRLDEFKTFFRVDRISVQYLLEEICDICRNESILGIIERQGSGGTEQKPLNERLLMLLWYMASLDKYSSIADRFGTSESTASYAIRNLITFIHDNLVKRVILWPTADEQHEMQDMYNELKGFPGVVGMLDGTHIKIRKPSVRGTDYYNRKDFYSVVLQGIVGEDLRFIDVYAGWPGKVHDARVLRHSPFFQNGETWCRDGHVLGDSAYPNLPWLLTPFRDNGHLTPTQKHYNTIHSSIRSNVERAFGLLKGRFTRLQFIDQRDIEIIVKTIITGCVLHNICILNNDTFLDILVEDPVPQPLVNVQRYDADAQIIGARKRLQISRALSE